MKTAKVEVQHLLRGLDGSNLLAFLAALGSLRVLTLAASRDEPPPRLGWRDEGGTWMPVLYTSTLATPDAIIERLASDCCRHRPSALRDEIDDLKASVRSLKQEIREARGKANAERRKRLTKELDALVEKLVGRESERNELLRAREPDVQRVEQLVKEFKEAEKSAARFEKELPRELERVETEERAERKVALQAELVKLRRQAADAERIWAAALERTAPAPQFALGDDFSVAPERFKDFASRAVNAATIDDRTWPDFVAAFASEACVNKKKLVVEETALCAVGGGNTRILNFIRDLLQETNAQHLRGALFDLWSYSDPPPSLRWDPNEYRPYALRANDPAPDQDTKVRGANRLAIEAMPFFPVVPSGSTGNRAATTGFARFDGELCISWPIWSRPLDADTIRGVLTHSLVQSSKPARSESRQLGIEQIFRSRRFTDGQYRNFTPSVSLI